MLLRTDPRTTGSYYLSIPRDLQVPIPGDGDAEDQRRVPDRRPGAGDQDDPRSSPGSTINHVSSSTSRNFKDLIDELGGITVNVPKPIRSNRFDCPFTTQAQCDRWQGWRFHKGPQHMNGERALIYSRIRENLLDPSRDGRDPRRAPAGGHRRDRGEVHRRLGR